jgi:hypothetical protein
MSMSIFDKRPPFVRFEEREMGLNAEATEKEGRPIPRVVQMACITPHGSKDVVEKIASEWIEQIHRKSLQGDYPVEWVNFFKASFEEWKKGNDLPREGTPVKTWQMCTREASTRLVAIGITTVEDLAEFPDSNLSVIGMDGRYLRDLARGWINEAKDKGANAKALADANVRIANLEATNTAQAERIDRLAARLEERESEGDNRRTAGRGRKGAEAA